MAARSKRARQVRRSGEFVSPTLFQMLKAPPRTSAAYSWDLTAIQKARDAQMGGQFPLAARLGQSMKSDSAIFSALLNRLAPARGLPVKVEPTNETARAKRIADEAEGLFGQRGVAISLATLNEISEQLVLHGVAFARNTWTPRADGSRVDVELHAWPIEFVNWWPAENIYRAQTHSGGVVDICASGPADGEWVVFRSYELKPWTWGAVVPLALVWADRAFGVRDRARSSTSHGNAKMIGELPEGVPIDSDEGHAFLQLLEAMHGDLPFGIRPFGAQTEMLVNTSQAWQIFKEIIDGRENDADTVLLGQAKSVVDSSQRLETAQLFGVRNDLVEGDLGTITDGILRGTIEPWTAINFGDSSLAPQRKWLMPDADEDARRASYAKQMDAFNKAIADARANEFVVDQDYVCRIADAYGVYAPTLKSSNPAGPSEQGSSEGYPAPSPVPAPVVPPVQRRRSLRAIP
jgi:phage gp29-like protein